MSRQNPFFPALLGFTVWTGLAVVSNALLFVLVPEYRILANAGYVAAPVLGTLFTLWQGRRLEKHPRNFRLFYNYVTDDEPARELMAKPKDPKDTHCKDCGKEFTVRQSQDGFDPKTGRAVISASLGCPDGDPLRQTGRAARVGGLLMSPTVSFPEYAWPDCGKRKTTGLLPPAHTHDAEVDTSADCPACITDMLENNIINHQTAIELLDKAGVKV